MTPTRILAIFAFTAACSSPAAEPAARGTTAAFDLTADYDSEAGFYALPQPSDLRLDAQGRPSFAGLANDKNLPTVKLLKAAVRERSGNSVLPVAYFRFDAPLADRDPAAVIAAAASSPILLVDVDPKSPERGKLLPTVAAVLPPDSYVPDDLLAVAARPGFVLRGDRRYAFVVKRALGDAAGGRLGVPDALAALSRGETPAGSRGAAAKALYDPLWGTLDALGVARDEVAVATVFTTGDVVREQLELGGKLRAKYKVTLDGLALDAKSDYPSLCVLRGTVSYPQFQKGKPPFDSDGLFAIGADGLPVHQRDEVAPVVIAIPKQPMPAAGYPLELFIHGSGGYSDALLSPLGDDDKPHVGAGPAHVLAPFGIAVAGSAMPVNPERLPGASETAYVNANNIPATRDIFRQGVIEQLLLLDALKDLALSPQLLAGCSGPSLPNSATAFRFDPGKLAGAGQSMGAWYINLIAPLEPRIQLVVPTGAGGYLTYFLTTAGKEQQTISSKAGAIGPVLFGVTGKLTFLHPAAALAETALEPADPMTGQPRVAAHPLAGMPARPIYTAVAPGDHYFSTATYEAVTLAYGNEEAGDVVWQGLPDALALDGRGKLLPYPVAQNRTSDGGKPYTGVTVAYQVQGFDPHALYQYDDRVKHQFGCFVSSFFATGTATVPGPGKIGDPCK